MAQQRFTCGRAQNSQFVERNHAEANESVEKSVVIDDEGNKRQTG
jgi:hypothetical protein